MARIVADLGKCDGIGMCESLCPEVFEVGDEGHVVLHSETVPDGMEQEVREAVESCPQSALSIED